MRKTSSAWIPAYSFCFCFVGMSLPSEAYFAVVYDVFFFFMEVGEARGVVTALH